MAFEHSSPDESSNLTTQDFSRNAIASIDNRTFAALTALTTLKLDFNNIEVIEADIFLYNRNLQFFDLSFNHIKIFLCQYFEKFSHYLDLSSNKLKFFDGSCMRSENYIDLFVGYNQLTNITLHSK